METTTFLELPTHVRVAIVGSGFAGLGMAARLLERGERDIAVLERGGDVGGTWRDNSYPGAACDVPSRLYSFSFAPNPEWSHSFSPQPEILDYLRDCAERFGVRPKLHTDCELQRAEWDELAGLWRLETSRGALTADLLISAAGALSDPKAPAIPGLERFAGTTFHTAAWNHEHALDGERVAVIGTGASAIQVVPKIQPQVAQLNLYQRTAAWIVPRTDRRFTRLERSLYRRLPALGRFARGAIYWTRELYVLGFKKPERAMKLVERAARRHLASQVPDPELRARLTPGYRIGCKRILISNDFYPALSRPNADVVTAPIAEVREHSIVTADGVERPTDTIIFATGFQVTPPPIAQAIHGRDGRPLSEVWETEGMQAHRGTTIAGFPNMFMLVGPNTGLGHTSMVYIIEAQINYVLEALEALPAQSGATLEPRPEAQQRYNAELQGALKDTVWQTGGCGSWYLDEHGNNVTLWPDFTFRFKRLTDGFDREHYELRTAPANLRPRAPIAQLDRATPS
ncbi:MAG: NAD(P)/FAD-dependent oxidoreductase [Solirubrobacteraceae bacterium]